MASLAVAMASRSLIQPTIQVSRRSCLWHSNFSTIITFCVRRPYIISWKETQSRCHYGTQRSSEARTNKSSTEAEAATSRSPENLIQFDRAFLDLCRKRLEEKPDTGAYFKQDPVRQAGVFMPLCIHKGVPSVLFTIRAKNMRNHRGEVSFPGGKRDPTDKTILDTALREMQEEISVSRDNVEVLGEYSPVPNKDCTMKVYPFVGLIKEPIEDINSIVFNKDEVYKVFTVPFQDLIDPQKKSMVQFRSSKSLYPVWKVEQENITIWGLTAFILDGVLRRISKDGPMDAAEIPKGDRAESYKPPNPSAFV